jgi:hypothetical protein
MLMCSRVEFLGLKSNLNGIREFSSFSIYQFTAVLMTDAEQDVYALSKKETV